MGDQVWVAIVSGMSAIVLSVVSWLLGRLKKTTAQKGLAETEITLQREGLDFTDFLTHWSAIDKELKELFDETVVDRFLLLRAWNGAHTPKWTTAFFQVLESNYRPISYVHFELDTDYVERLREVRKDKSLRFSTDEIPDSAIKSVYQMEGVKHSLWFHLADESVGEKGVAITYCSFATHHEEPIPDDLMVRCSLLVNRIKSFYDMRKTVE